MERLQHRSSHYFTKLFNLAFSDFSEAKRCFERMGFPTHGSYLLLAPLSCFRHGASLEICRCSDSARAGSSQGDCMGEEGRRWMVVLVSAPGFGESLKWKN